MSSSTDFDAWFPAASKQGPFPLGVPKLRLVCFPSSGTMEAVYTQKTRGADKKMHENALMAWAKKEAVEVLSVQLPGRGKRHKVPPTRPNTATHMFSLANVLIRCACWSHRFLLGALSKDPQRSSCATGPCACAPPPVIVGHQRGRRRWRWKWWFHRRRRSLRNRWSLDGLLVIMNKRGTIFLD